MFLIFMGCSNSNSKEIEDFSKKTPLVYIPNAGCPGCISFAEEFLLRNKGSKCVSFILVNVLSEKQLKIKLGYDILDYLNITLENGEIFDQYGVSGFYPFIVYSTGKVDEISPENQGALKSLEDYLISNCDL
ncbi:thioredoxin domain-containing protein [Algoriphagus aquaeductus]|nr:hypothetical protein [Algoriphagus aquaeductus]